MPAGPRIRSNSEFGLITDNPLTAGATVFNSARLALFPVVASAHAVVTLDPRAQFGEPEIVIITAHTASATVATIVRGAYGTVARQHPVNTEWIHAPVNEDVIQNYTGPGDVLDPYRGQLFYNRTLDKYVARDQNDAWIDALPLGAWRTYVPVHSGITVGSGTEIAKYTRLGSLVVVHWKLTFAADTSVTTPAVGLPVNTATGDGHALGAAWLFDSSPSTQMVGVARQFGAGDFSRISTDSGTVTSASPWTWATGDVMSIIATYEAAS